MKSDIVRRRNTSMIIFQLLKAIHKIEDSTEENQKKENKPPKKKWAEQQQIFITEAKQNCPNQNAINLCNLEISDSTRSILRKGPSYLPSPNDINLYKFYNRARFRLLCQ